jgi:putative transposase
LLCDFSFFLDFNRVRTALEFERVFDDDLPMREAVSLAATELRLSTQQVYNHRAQYREGRRV